MRHSWTGVLEVLASRVGRSATPHSYLRQLYMYSPSSPTANTPALGGHSPVFTPAQGAAHVGSTCLHDIREDVR